MGLLVAVCRIEDSFGEPSISALPISSPSTCKVHNRGFFTPTDLSQGGRHVQRVAIKRRRQRLFQFVRPIYVLAKRIRE